MSVDSAVAAGRAAAEARMVGRCVVRRKTGNTTTVGGMEVDEWATAHTDLPIRLDGGSSSDGGSRTVTIGGVAFEEATAVAHLPADTGNLEDDDLIDITSGEWAGDVYRIVAAIKGDQKTARRIPIVEDQRPEEW